jgi:hypothetical protein
VLRLVAASATPALLVHHDLAQVRIDERAQGARESPMPDPLWTRTLAPRKHAGFAPLDPVGQLQMCATGAVMGSRDWTTHQPPHPRDRHQPRARDILLSATRLRSRFDSSIFLAASRRLPARGIAR